MDKKDNKIITFPNPDSRNSTPGHNNSKSRHPFFKHSLNFLMFVIASILIPVIGFVLGPYISKNIGNTEISDSYVMPYIYALSPQSANYNSPAASTPDDTHLYACALRTCFSCSKVSIAQATDNTLHILSVEEYQKAELQYHCLAFGESIYLYAINAGDGASSPSSLGFNAKMTDGVDDINGSDIKWEHLIKNPSVPGLPLDVPSIEGGDGLEVCSFELSDWAWERLREGAQFRLFINVGSKDEENELFLGNITLIDGRLAMELGGAGPGDDTVLNYVYIPVDEISSGSKLPVHATFLIQDRATADTVLIPNKSCRLKYTMTYEVDGKELMSGPFTTTFYVPLYKSMSTLNIAQFMNEHGLTQYKYKSNTELHEQNRYVPESLMEISG